LCQAGAAAPHRQLRASRVVRAWALRVRMDRYPISPNACGPRPATEPWQRLPLANVPAADRAQRSKNRGGDRAANAEEKRSPSRFSPASARDAAQKTAALDHARTAPCRPALARSNAGPVAVDESRRRCLADTVRRVGSARGCGHVRARACAGCAALRSSSKSAGLGSARPKALTLALIAALKKAILRGGARRQRPGSAGSRTLPVPRFPRPISLSCCGRIVLSLPADPRATSAPRTRRSAAALVARAMRALAAAERLGSTPLPVRALQTAASKSPR